MKFLNTLKRIFSDKGLLLTAGLGLTMLLYYYGGLLLHPSLTYFGAGNPDGFQIYYETLYHVKFDHGFWRQTSINYPYGESIFYTGALPFINNFAKLFGHGAGGFAVWLINVVSLFSVPAGAVFIYAIFRHLRVTWFYGALCSVGIAFLSPQIIRLTGQYSLSWVFLVPGLFYLLLRFYDYPSLKKSFAIAFLTFLAITTHIYFFLFFVGIGLVYWFVLFITRDRGFGRIVFALKHGSIQFILPLLIFQFIVMYSDTVTDRSQVPWGYLVYFSDLYGVFYPFLSPYERLVHSFVSPDVNHLEWEGISYVGAAAIIGMVMVALVQLFMLFRHRFRFRISERKGIFFRVLWWTKEIFRLLLDRLRLLVSVTDNKVLNIFFWTSVLLLYISFALPFRDQHEDWLLYLGPVRQFRSIGRLAWVFYYALNIVVVYRLHKVFMQRKAGKIIFTALIPGLMFYDGYYNNYRNFDLMNSRIPELEDNANTLPQDQWLTKIKTQDYQAILPLPFFHNGSENIAIFPPDGAIVKETFVLSLKTGLPVMAVQSGRVSLGQTMKVVALEYDPVKEIPVLDDLRDKRPLLVIVKPGSINENEKRILSLATKVGESTGYSVYSLDPAALRKLPGMAYDSARAEFDTVKKYPVGNFFCTDSMAHIIYDNYENGNGKPYRGNHSQGSDLHTFTVVVDKDVNDTGKYIASFWVNDISKDCYGRSLLKLTTTDSTGKNVDIYSSFSVQLKAIDGPWGLIEIPFTMPGPKGHFQIIFWNADVKPSSIIYTDELLVHSQNADVFRQDGESLYFNNRIYSPAK
ncbi:MAG TPA: hypothetical protein VFU15_15550 [Bacteroidia bacterium]|nr:hypothetical protein [Bacteroidia bacterium]